MNIVLPGGNELDVYESQYTPEQIEASIGKGPVVENGTWWVWSVADSAYQDTGVEATSIPSNPDILINSDFRQPVNRQGKVEYIGSGYAIDRWRMRSEIEVTIGGTGVHLSLDNANALKAFSQPVENPKQYAGLTLTFSVLLANNTMEFALDSYAGWGASLAATDALHSKGIGKVQPEGDGLFSVTFTVPEDFGEYEYLNVGLYAGRCTGSVDVKACKLELGDKQTLAHQDESGNWVLNDPPNYALQYLLTSLYSPTTGEWVGIQHSNPNLLDNWYFIGGGSQQGGGQFPINQRGEAVYDSTVQSPYYCIDRYLLRQAHLQLTDDGIVLSGNGSGDPYLFQQTAPDVANALKGKTVTFSALIKNFSGDGNVRWMISSGGAASYVGTVYGETYDNGDGLVVVTTTLPDTYAYDRLQVSCRLMKQTGLSFTIVAMKLELGSVQTLARQDADGNWVLNDPPPNFALELAKCQRYQYVIKHSVKDSQTPSWPGCISSAGKWLHTFVVLPVPLAKIPAVVYQNVTTTIRTISGYSNIATYNEPGTPASMSVQYLVGSQDLVLMLTFTSEIGTNNTPSTISLRSGQIILDANL